MSPRVAPCFLVMGSVVENLVLPQEFSTNESSTEVSKELRLTKNLKSESSFRPQRVVRELGETLDTKIDKKSIILNILRL